jgi:MFS family permease
LSSTGGAQATVEAGVFAPGRRALTGGLVFTVVLVGFESLAVSTALPDITRELSGLRWYGLVLAAYMLGNLLGITIAGERADRRGAAEPFAIGLAVFSVGLLMAGWASSMPALVVARFVQGFGGGAIPAMAYVCAGRGYPPELRPRVFAAMAAAWVVPGMGGAVLSAWITVHLGWRWIFFGLLPLVALAAAVTIPALRALAPSVVTTESDQSRIFQATWLAVGTGLAFVGSAIGLATPFVVVLSLMGSAIALRAYLRLVPAGTLQLAPGLPAAIGIRAFQTISFFGFDAFVPYAFHDVRGSSLAVASLAVSAATLAWSAGASVSDRSLPRLGPRRLVTLEMVLVGIGTAGTAAVVFEAWPVPLAIASAGLAGFGMGLGYSIAAVVMLAYAEPGREGTASSALSLTDVLTTAIATGVGGACIGLGVSYDWLPRSGLLLATAFALVAAATGIVAAARLPRWMPMAAIGDSETRRLPPSRAEARSLGGSGLRCGRP